MNFINPDSDCLNYIMLGNCPTRDQCLLNHPEMKPQKKSKLQFRKNNEFKPQTPIPPQPSTSTCKCCRGTPDYCRNDPVCISMGRCFCAAHEQLNSEMNKFEDSEPIDCNCCHGDIYNCSNTLCQQLGLCQCQMHKDLEDNEEEDDENFFVAEYSDCKCCGGFVFGCSGIDCPGPCKCFM